jgi:hypothetical protein
MTYDNYLFRMISACFAYTTDEALYSLFKTCRRIVAQHFLECDMSA